MGKKSFTMTTASPVAKPPPAPARLPPPVASDPTPVAPFAPRVTSLAATDPDAFVAARPRTGRPPSKLKAAIIAQVGSDDASAIRAALKAQVKATTIYLPKPLARRVRDHCEDTGQTMTDLVVLLLERELGTSKA